MFSVYVWESESFFFISLSLLLAGSLRWNYTVNCYFDLTLKKRPRHLTTYESISSTSDWNYSDYNPFSSYTLAFRSLPIHTHTPYLASPSGSSSLGVSFGRCICLLDDVGKAIDQYTTSSIYLTEIRSNLSNRYTGLTTIKEGKSNLLLFLHPEPSSWVWEGKRRLWLSTDAGMFVSGIEYLPFKTPFAND